jgi:hypothetical protein
MARSLVCADRSLTFPASIPSRRARPSGSLPVSTDHAVTNHWSRVFNRPLFSYSYELLFPQPLYFHNHPHCPRVSPSSIRSYRVATAASSVASAQIKSSQRLARSFSLLPPFFPLPSFIFNRLRTLSQKHPGWVPPGVGFAETQSGDSDSRGTISAGRFRSVAAKRSS